LASLLVTGGAGFIGSAFVRHWRRQYPDDRLVVLDALTYAGRRENLAGLDGQPGYRFVHGDIRDRDLVERLLRDEPLDTIVNFAAETHVDRSIEGPGAFVDTNVGGTLALLEAARAIWLAGDGVDHRFHHVSTDEVYGELAAGSPAVGEGATYRPNSPYAASKAAADHLVRAWHRTYGLQTTVSVCTNNYGPRQFPEKLIPLTILNLLRGLPLPIYGDGAQRRDWLHVDDHAHGVECVLLRGEPGRLYHLAAREEHGNLELIEAICDAMDRRFADDEMLAARFPDAPPARRRASRTAITHVADRPGHDRRYAIDDGLARSELGYEPRRSLVTGLEETLDWYLAHEDWWRPLLGGEYGDWLKRQYGQ
jgi:dTDP-glucose 4,6-dehydratase